MAVESKMLDGSNQTDGTYPKLMTHREDNDLVVLFVEEDVGVVVWSEDSDIDVGCDDLDWCEKDFVPFFGRIELTSNSD